MLRFISISIFLSLVGLRVVGQAINEVPLLGLHFIEPFTLSETNSSYYFITGFHTRKFVAGKNLPTAAYYLNKSEKTTHKILKTVKIWGDTAVADSTLSYNWPCLSGDKILVANSRYHFLDSSIFPHAYNSIVFTCFDTNLNLIVPERRLITFFTPFKRFAGGDIIVANTSRNRFITGYAMNDSFNNGHGRYSRYLFTDFSGNLLRDSVIGVAPSLDSPNVNHYAHEIVPTGNNQLLVSGQGLTNPNAASPVADFLLTDSNMSVIDTFRLKSRYLYYGSAQVQGWVPGILNYAMLPTSSIIAGRELQVFYGTPSMRPNGNFTMLMKMTRATRYTIDTTFFFPVTNSYGGNNSSPSQHNLVYQPVENRVYYATNTLQAYGFTGDCGGSTNQTQVVCLDTNLHMYWQKFISPAAGSCTHLTDVIASIGRPGITIAGYFTDANAPKDTALQGGFLFHIDSTGTLDAPGAKLFSIRDRFRIYPNPANDALFIDDVLKSVSAATVIDMQGREVVKTAITANPARLSLQSLPPATYLLRLTLKDGGTHSQLFSRQE